VPHANQPRPGHILVAGRIHTGIGYRRVTTLPPTAPMTFGKLKKSASVIET